MGLRWAEVSGPPSLKPEAGSPRSFVCLVADPRRALGGGRSFEAFQHGRLDVFHPLPDAVAQEGDAGGGGGVVDSVGHFEGVGGQVDLGTSGLFQISLDRGSFGDIIRYSKNRY